MLGFLPFTREGRRRAAARWLARMHGPNAETYRRDFERWSSVPSNAAAFTRVSKSYDAAALLRLGEPNPARDKSSKRPSVQAIAASALFVCALGGLLISRPYFLEDAAPRLMLSTTIGEIKTVRLTDGSRVTLDTDTQLEIADRQRPIRAILKRGRVRFSPAESMVVQSDLTIVKSDGGKFDVALTDRGVSVTNFDGKVTIQGLPDSPTGSMQLGPGQALWHDGETRQSGMLADQNWPAGLLEFDDVPLEIAIERANRYSTAKIRLGDKHVAQLRLAGVFKAGDNDAIARAISQAFDLRIEKAGADIILISRNEP